MRINLQDYFLENIFKDYNFQGTLNTQQGEQEFKIRTWRYDSEKKLFLGESYIENNLSSIIGKITPKTSSDAKITIITTNEPDNFLEPNLFLVGRLVKADEEVKMFGTYNLRGVSYSWDTLGVLKNHAQKDIENELPMTQEL